MLAALVAASRPRWRRKGPRGSRCCRSRTPAPTARTRRCSRRWSSGLPGDARPRDRPPPRRRRGAAGAAGRAMRAARASARRSGWMRRAPPRSARGPARATPSPAASRISTGSSGSTRGWWMRESGEIVKVVSNDDPKLQDRAQLAAIVQVGGREDHRGRRAAGLPRRGRAAGRFPPTRSPRTAGPAAREPGRPRQGDASSTRAR